MVVGRELVLDPVGQDLVLDLFRKRARCVAEEVIGVPEYGEHGQRGEYPAASDCGPVPGMAVCHDFQISELVVERLQNAQQLKRLYLTGGQELP